MAIREQGYRHWEGQYTSHAWRWWTITKASLRSTVYTKGRLLLLIVLAALAWVLPFFFGVFYFFGEITSRFRQPDDFLRENLYQMLLNWQWMWGIIFSAVVGSRLVANDLRSEALYIYLAKPLRRMDYIIGKFLACFLWLIPVTIGPAVWVFLAAAGSTNRILKLTEPWEIFGELLLVYLLYAVVCAACAVALSSLTKRWTLALIAWVGGAFLLALLAPIPAAATNKWEWLYISPRHNILIVAEHIWEQDTAAGPQFPGQIIYPEWVPAFWILIALLVVALATFTIRMMRLEVAE